MDNDGNTTFLAIFFSLIHNFTIFHKFLAVNGAISIYHMYQCCIFRSVPTGTDGKSHTGMQTGTRHPHVPPRPKFRPVSAGICNPAGILFSATYNLQCI